MQRSVQPFGAFKLGNARLSQQLSRASTPEASTPSPQIGLRAQASYRRSRRMFSMDIVRGVAVALVLLNHMPMGTLPPATWFESFVRTLQDAGWVGVDLFFVLSGYLISRILFQEIDRTGTIALGRFWLRRGFKIWPSYFCGIRSHDAALGRIEPAIWSRRWTGSAIDSHHPSQPHLRTELFSSRLAMAA
ncbi:MAG: acyltransferase family protein [Gemmatimonadetes bacterium]|nr:acyltransferase family protein [Gemmatimonadota bacterium]